MTSDGNFDRDIVSILTLLPSAAANSAIKRITSMESEIRELREKLGVAEDALALIGAYFDCLSCESLTGYTCEHHLDDRMNKAREALEKLRAND